MSANNGGSAFPTGTQVAQNTATGETVIHQYLSDGMTLRDYFASKAMASILNCQPPEVTDSNRGQTIAEYVAHKSYAMADAMLKARES